MKKADSSSSDSVSTTSQESRGTWGHTAEFLLSSVGYAVGLGNLWRFPYLCFRNGGGAFLIPYTLFLLLCGIPLVFMEMSIGQYAGAGPLSIWSLCPLAKGLGICMVIVSMFCCIYYNVIIMWTLYYLFNSFSKVLPWAECGDWSSDSCRPLGVTSDKMNETLCAGQNSTANSSTACLLAANDSATATRYPAQEFWDVKVLSRSSGIADMNILRWDLALILLLAWTLVFLCLIKGIKSSGKVVYVTATLPYILLTILLVQGATMDGSIDGIMFYLKPNFTMLTKPTVWAEACGQIFFSQGAAWGGLITMASYNKFNTNVYRFSIVVPLINCATSLYAGFVIFSVLGYMAKQAGVDIRSIADGGPGLIFVAYPYAISTLPVPQLWSVLFFLMVLTVGLDSQFGMFETFTTCVFDELPQFFTTRLRKLLFTGMLCMVCYLVGLLCCTDAGIYYFQLMDWYIGIFSLLFISLIECLIVAWVYGVDRLYRDIEMMVGKKPVVVFKYMWKFVTPAIIVVMLIYSLVTYQAPVYNDKIPYPDTAIGLAWVYGVCSSFPIPLYAAYLLWTTRNEDLTLWQRVLKYLQPSPDWGSKKHQLDISESTEDVLPLDNQSSQEDMDMMDMMDEEKEPLNSSKQELSFA